MGLFSRTREIMSSNVNALLEKAENPEKMIRLIIRQMEDAMVDVKRACAAATASGKRAEREAERVRARVEEWQRKAELALSRGREDLAREALRAKKRHERRLETVEREVADCNEMVSRYREDLVELEAKLQGVLEKQRVLVQRHSAAQTRKRAQRQIRRVDSEEVVLRFERMEQHVQRLEERAGLTPGRHDLAREIERLAAEEEIEQELDTLKERMRQKAGV